MKKNLCFLTLLLILLAFVGCDSGLSPYFNLPTIESEYDFQVHYFFRSRRQSEDLRRGIIDDYALEREGWQAYPEGLERSWRQSHFCHEHQLRSVIEIRVATSVEELAEPSLTEYSEYFFQSNYLVIIELAMPMGRLDELVHRIEANGTIQFRPNMSPTGSVAVPSHHTVIIELDNRFQPPGFSVVFIDNPWATCEG